MHFCNDKIQVPKRKTKEEEAEEAKLKAEKEAKRQTGYLGRFFSYFSQQSFLREFKDMFSQAFKKREDDPVSQVSLLAHLA